MIPKLYGINASDDYLYDPTFLVNATKCTVTEELNGKYELKLVCDIEYAYIIRLQKIISVDVPAFYYSDATTLKHSKEQLFRIYRIVKSSNRTLTAYARHISYDLNGVPVAPFSITAVSSSTEKTVVTKLNNSIKDTQDEELSAFSVAQVMSGTWSPFRLAYPKSLRAAIFDKDMSFIAKLGGEADYLDKGRQIVLYNRRGADRGYKITYGINLLSFTEDNSFSHQVIGYLPYYYSETLSVFGSVVSNGIRPANTKFYVEPINVTDIVLENFKALIESDDISLEEKAAFVTQCGKYYLEDNLLYSVGATTYKVNFLMLGDTEEYRELKTIERVLLGDTVKVYHPELDVNIGVRCIKTEYNVLAERYNSVELSSKATAISDTVFDMQEKIIALEKQTAQLRARS